MKIQGAIFDMDGTLINSLVLWDILWAEYGRRYCGGKPFAPSTEDEQKIHTTTLHDGLGFIGRRYGLPADADELTRVANEVFVDFYTNKLEPKPGAIELLEGLRARGVRLCLASASTRDMVDLALTRCDMHKYFPAFSPALRWAGTRATPISICRPWRIWAPSRRRPGSLRMLTPPYAPPNGPASTRLASTNMRK